MASSNGTAGAPSRDSRENPQASRFTAQAATAEDLLKAETVGLVGLADFLKRRAEALERKERETSDRTLGRSPATSRSGTATPVEG